jgi:hypothetical protein
MSVEHPPHRHPLSN